MNRLPDVKLATDINVLAIDRGNDRFVFIFDDAHKAEVLRVMGRFASDPDLNFGWFEAAVLSQRINGICD